jgi:probable O-glycosylation ligase (exosortase A-associated)
VTGLLVLLGACVTLTTLTAMGPQEAAWLMWDRVIKIMLGLVLTSVLLTDRWRVHALVWLIVISLGFYGVKGGIFTVITGGVFIVLGPPDSMIGDRNHLSVALLFAIPLMNYLRQNSRHAVTRGGLVFAMATTLFAVVGSQSRGGLIALAATSFMLWMRSRGKLLSGIVIAFGVAMAVLFMPESWVARMETIQTFDQDNSARARLRIWEIALMLAFLRPWTGVGFKGTYYRQVTDLVAPGDTARAVHSIWLEVLAEHGFPTFFVWLAALLAGVFYSLRVTRLARGRPDLRWAYDLARMAQVSVVAYCTGGSFLSLSYWDCFWTLMVILGAVHALVVAAVQAEAMPMRTMPLWSRDRQPVAAERQMARS